LTPFLPDAAGSHGGSIYLGALSEALAAHADLGLVALRQADDADLTSQAPWQWRGLAAYTGHATGLARLPHLLRMGFYWGARRLPLLVAKHWQPEIPRLLRSACAAFRPDAVMVELAVMAQYLPCLQGLPTVLTDHEAGAPENPVTGLGTFADRRDEHLWRRYVQSSYRRASLLQALTEEDATRLQHELDIPVHRRQAVVAVAAARIAIEKAPPRALFLGDYRHHPNPEAVRILVRDVLPRIRAQLPEAELWVAGPNPDRIQDLAAVAGVHVSGFATDLPALLAQVRCMLVPMYSGGGFRVKALTALAHGLPVVTNRLGARGADAPAPARTLGESPAELAAAALALMTSPARAATASVAAHAWAMAHLSADVVARAQIDRIQVLLQASRSGA
jgi:Glycosyl transferases group 1